jgi:hypothetical protein
MTATHRDSDRPTGHRPTVLRVPIPLIVLVLMLAAAADVVGLYRFFSEQPAALSLQFDSPGLHAQASAGVVVLDRMRR